MPNSQRALAWLRGGSAALVCSVLVTTLASCDSAADGEPTPAPVPSTTTATTSAPPSPSAPTMPADAQGTSAKAAKAFVRFYIALINHAMATGETTELRAASADGCESCNAVIGRVEDVYAQGGHIKSKGWAVRSIQLVPGTAGAHPSLDIGLRLSPQRVYKAPDAAPERFPGGRLPITIGLEQIGSRWQVTQWVRSA